MKWSGAWFWWEFCWLEKKIVTFYYPIKIAKNSLTLYNKDRTVSNEFFCFVSFYSFSSKITFPSEQPKNPTSPWNQESYQIPYFLGIWSLRNLMRIINVPGLRLPLMCIWNSSFSNLLQITLLSESKEGMKEEMTV